MVNNTDILNAYGLLLKREVLFSTLAFVFILGRNQSKREERTLGEPADLFSYTSITSYNVCLAL